MVKYCLLFFRLTEVQQFERDIQFDMGLALLIQCAFWYHQIAMICYRFRNSVFNTFIWSLVRLVLLFYDAERKKITSNVGAFKWRQFHKKYPTTYSWSLTQFVQYILSHLHLPSLHIIHKCNVSEPYSCGNQLTATTTTSYLRSPNYPEQYQK